MSPQDLVVVSNRGPVSFIRDDDGSLVARRGAGGLVSSLAPLLSGTGAAWVAAAMNADDRQAAEEGLAGGGDLNLSLVDIDPDTYEQAYGTVANATLWFLHHGLFDLSRQPRFDPPWHEAWKAYVRYNQAFTTAVAASAPSGATVLVQDYHLCLVGQGLAEARPDISAVHFSHTPFCDPYGIRVLPDYAARQLLSGMASYDACGFHAPRWAQAFRDCCQDVLGQAPPTFVSPVGADQEDLARVAASPACLEAGEDLDRIIRGRRLILRVDRMEPSKNLLRGFAAYDELLRQRPDLVTEVVFLAVTYPSRETLAEYRRYGADVASAAAEINRKWGRPDWEPVALELSDDFPRSVAALQRYDVLLVNPIRDGLNLVAKEGPSVNQRHGVLALSREAGAWPELGGDALEVNPFDVAGTARILAQALDMEPSERRERSLGLKTRVAARTPQDWLADQMDAARSALTSP